MKNLKLDLFSDPSHAWLKVPLKMLERMSVSRSITEFSYIRGQFAYLEEDIDLGRFAKACELHGVRLRIRSNYSDRASRIRNYDRYSFTNFQKGLNT